MSISAETAKEHAKDPAVLCCRAEEGTVIQASNLEDPAIFDDLVESGLLNLDGALTIGQVIGATMTKTCDSLTALTADNLKGYTEAPAEEAAPAEEEAPAEEAAPAAEEAPADEAPAAPAAPAAAAPASFAGGMMKIHIGEGKDINLEIPTGVLSGNGAAPAAPAAVAGGMMKIHIGEGKDIDLEIPTGVFGGSAAAPAAPAAVAAQVAGAAAPAEEEAEGKVVRDLTRKHYKITEVKRGPETKIEGTTLYIREGIEKDVIADQAGSRLQARDHHTG